MSYISSSKTINFWINTTASSVQRIFAAWDGTNYLQIFTNRFPNTLSYSLYDGIHEMEVYMTNPTYRNGNWHMVTITQSSANNSGMKIYLDGVLQNLINHENGTVNSVGVNANQFLGAFNGNPASYFSGKLDEFKIWDRALLASEIEDMYY